MVSDASPPASRARTFPDDVPVLLDPGRGVTLRAHEARDTADLVEACNDPEILRWTTVPTPAGGYGVADAQEFLALVAAGWESGEHRHWALEAGRDAQPRFCGGIHLADLGDGQGEVGFLLHPAARGRSLMSSALRLVRDYAVDVAGFEVLRWRALPGNWASRRVAAAAGFAFDGCVRRSLPHRGQLRDAWVATFSADDPRASLSWTDPPVLRGPRVRLRPLTAEDAERVVQACSDDRSRHWLVSLPRPYGLPAAQDFIESGYEHAARGTGLHWCIADLDTDRYLGSISLEGLGGYSRRAEIGYLAHPAARGAGVVTEAVRLVTGYAEDHDLVDSLVIRCAAENTASRQVARAAGYAEAGVLPASEPLGDDTLADLVSYSRP